MRIHTEDVRIPAGDAVLAGTLLAPAGAGPRPGVILVSGSGQHDRDETVCGHKPFRVVADYVAPRGYAVLRCDDRGVGGSTGDAGAQDFGGSVADVCAMARWLAAHPAVDAERLVLVGHSEGGLVAAAAAPAAGVRAVVMLAGPSLPIERLLHDQARAISTEAGATAAQIAHERRMNERVFALVRSDRDRSLVEPEIEDVIRRHLLSWPDAPAWDDHALHETARLMTGVVSAPAYRSLLRQDPAVILERFTGALLAVYGGRDTQVPGVANAEAFRRITAGRRRAAVRLFPNHNHLFQQAATGAISEYERLAPGPDAEVLREVVHWLAAAVPGPTSHREGDAD